MNLDLRPTQVCVPKEMRALPILPGPTPTSRPTGLKTDHQRRRRALVTGVTGQDGYYISEFLLSQGYEVFGLIRGQNNIKARLLAHELPDLVQIPGDLLDPSSLTRALQIARPDEVYHLAAMSFVAYSWNHPQLTMHVNAGGSLNLLEAVRYTQDQFGAEVRYYQASSAEMFGAAREPVLRESTRFWPRSPYGVAKASAHHMAVNYRESYDLHVSCGILFNHESPRRGTEFVTRKITTGVARIAAGLQDTIALGNLDAVRDWGYAGDYVRAMHLMLQQEAPDDYVIATGQGHTVRDLLDTAFRTIGVDDWTDHVVLDPRMIRPAEVDVLLGDSSKAQSALGWTPQVSFAELIRMMVIADQKRLVNSQ